MINDLFSDASLNEIEIVSHNWLAAIIYSSDDAIISKTLDGIVSSWNEGARRIFGYTAEEMIGQPILRLIPEDRKEEEAIILERLKRGERVDHFETKRVSKSGVLLDISLSISPIRDREGRIIGASKIARDITSQKLNERLLKSNHELEQFAYIASHDLQEPLRKIHVFSELLEDEIRRGGDQAVIDNYLNKIKHASVRMSSLISGVLEYSRFSRNEQTYTSVDLNEVIKDVLLEFDLKIAESKAVPEVGELPVIKGAATQFHQLFRNLIGNSLKFCQGHPHISITADKASPEELPPALASEQGTSFVRISVRDNGIGFESKHAARIFDIFQRLNGQNTYNGSGIGLAICKRIVENHGGAIRAEGEPGKGAAFHIFLPG
jgi:PAS domain S-box-containing protein